jgi:hypothetical protein
MENFRKKKNQTEILEIKTFLNQNQNQKKTQKTKNQLKTTPAD